MHRAHGGGYGLLTTGVVLSLMIVPLIAATLRDAILAGPMVVREAAAAPGPAMAFVGSNLVDGEPHFTQSQVAPNDTIVVVAFALIVELLPGLLSITVPRDTLLVSVVIYIVVPVLIARLGAAPHGVRERGACRLSTGWGR
ncbi:MAG: hypothetical protein ACP5NP_08965 [Acetobacteraceae bacterium]